MNQPESNKSNRDPYRGVVIVLLAAAALGSAGAFAGGFQLADPVLLAVAVTLGLSAGGLAGVATAQVMRPRPPQRAEVSMAFVLEEPPAAETPEAEGAEDAATEMRVAVKLRSRLTAVSRRMALWYGGRGSLGKIRLGTAVVGALAICFLLLIDTSGFPPYPLPAAIAAALCLIAAGIAATAVRSLGEIEPAQFPESPALRRGARALA